MGNVVKKEKVSFFKRARKLYPDIYVLMRLYCPKDTTESYYVQLEKAICSVRINKEEYARNGGRVILLLNDDSPYFGSDHYFGHRNHLFRCLREEGFSPEDYVLVETDGKGSSFANYYIRQTFLDLTSDDDTIAVTLDQDDTLKSKALNRIADKMFKNGVVISPFEVTDAENLDILDDGGRRHNRLARRLNYSFWRKMIAYNQDFISAPHYVKYYRPKSLIELLLLCKYLLNNLGVWLYHCWASFCHRCVGIQNLPDLSSIGWTKSYTRSVLSQYHQDLTFFLNMERPCHDAMGQRIPSVDTFFFNHRAYEDFIDFYALLLSKCVVSGSLHVSHTYLKHKDSITSSPRVEDFRNHRTAMLITLIDLCYCMRDRLRSDFEYKLLRFISTKVYQVDHIIAKYRNDFLSEGKDQYNEFNAQTHDGYFISKLSRLALGENRGTPQDKMLFQFETDRGKNSKSNIEALFCTEHLNSVPEYHLKLKNTHLRFAIRKAVECEALLVGENKNISIDEAEINALYGKNQTPQQKRLLTVSWLIAGWFVFFALMALATIISNGSSTVYNYKEIVAALISIWVAVLTYLLNERSKVKLMATEEASLQKLYYSEFIDFIRHLEANLKVMIQIRKKIKGSPGLAFVEAIHFENLSWPENSCLFSDDMAKIISKERVDEFSRLKVNLRNINNSSRWLRERIATTGVRGRQEIIEWEITRHIGYLINMYYMKENEFNFASQNELDMFLNENSIKHRLTDLFMDYPADVRNDEVDYFLNKYYDDRRMRRDVLVF